MIRSCRGTNNIRDCTHCTTANGSVIVSGAAGGSGTYLYNIDGLAFGSATTFNNLTSGSHTVIVRDADYPACEVTLPAINVAPAVALSASLDSTSITCNGTAGGEIIITAPNGGSGTYEYSINGSASYLSDAPHTGGYTFTGLGAGPHNIVIRDRSQPACTTTLNSNFTINQPAAITASVTSSPVTHCTTANGSVIVSGAAGGSGTYLYNIDGLAFGSATTFNNLTSGSHTVIVRDAVYPACEITLPAINVAPAVALSASLDSTSITCNGTAGGEIIITAPNGGSGTYEYSINGGTSYDSDAPHTGGYTITGLGAGPHNIVIRDRSQPACTTTLNSNFTINQPAAITASVTSTSVSCSGRSDASITFNNVAGGTAPYAYSVGQAFQPSNSFNNLPAGTYPTAIKDVNGCSLALTDLIITPLPVASAIISATNVSGCKDSNNGAIEITPSQGAATDYYYYINTTGTWQANPSFTDLPVGKYTVKLKSALDCIMDVDTVFIANPDPFLPTAITNHSLKSLFLCEGTNAASFAVATTGHNLSFSWEEDGVLLTENSDYTGVNSDSLVINKISSSFNNRKFVVRISGTCGPSIVSDTFTLKVIPQTVPGNISGNAGICPGDTAMYMVSDYTGTIKSWETSVAPYTSWTSLAHYNDTLHVRHSLSTRVRVTLSNDGCPDFVSDFVETIVHHTPVLEVSNDTTIVKGKKAKLLASGATNYLWSPSNNITNENTASPTVAPMASTTYSVSATNQFGCSSTAYTTVNVRNENKIDIPNTFTPNGDGINDFWEIEGIEDFSNATINIYNRWGMLLEVLESNLNKWDGIANGQPLPFGTYFYIINLKNGSDSIAGSVSIIK